VIALVLGAALVAGIIVVVILPLLTPGYRRAHPMASPRDATESDAVPAIDALREIEFDRATGKLSDTDYAELRATYAPRALAEIRQSERPPIRQCGTCLAAISDPDARFCARCGLPLAA
jgi:hypothetical protein